MPMRMHAHACAWICMCRCMHAYAYAYACTYAYVHITMHFHPLWAFFPDLPLGVFRIYFFAVGPYLVIKGKVNRHVEFEFNTTRLAQHSKL